MIGRLNEVTKQKSMYESAVDEMIKEVSASLIDLVSGIVYGVAKIDIKDSIKRKKGFFKRIKKGTRISADEMNTMLPLQNALSVVRENIKNFRTLSPSFSSWTSLTAACPSMQSKCWSGCTMSAMRCPWFR